MIAATAPSHGVLVGNPADFYGGSVLACSTRERVRCSLTHTADETTIIVSGQTRHLQSMDDLALRDGDIFNVVRAALLALEIDPASTAPFRLEVDLDSPLSPGKIGSTALLTTIVGCMLAYLELRLNRYEIAELVRKIEYDVLHIVCGFHEHYMSVFGGLNFLDFRGKDSVQNQDAVTPFATVEPLAGYLLSDLPLLLMPTAKEQDSASTDHRWLPGDTAAVEGCREVSGLVRQAKRALLACDWDKLATLMDRNYRILRDLGDGSHAQDGLIAAAVSGGALGANLAEQTAAHRWRF